MNGLPPNRERGLGDFVRYEYILLGDLRDLLEEDPGEQNSRWLVAVLDALLDTVPREFELKSENGYLSDVLNANPHWEAQVEQLRAEYVRLCVWLEELRNRVVSGTPFREIADRLRKELSEWIEAVQDHHRRERQMVQVSANLEVGCGD
jgi:hypothetical protein